MEDQLASEIESKARKFKQSIEDVKQKLDSLFKEDDMLQVRLTSLEQPQRYFLRLLQSETIRRASFYAIDFSILAT